MKLINDIRCFSINSEFQSTNSIYKDEIIRLTSNLKKLLDEYEDFCSKMYGYDFDFPTGKQVSIKKSKLKDKYHLNVFLGTLNIDKELLEKYTNSSEKIELNIIYILYNNMIQRYYDAINLVRLSKQSKNLKTNTLFNTYKNEYKERYINNSLFTSPRNALCYITNEAIYNSCVNLVTNFEELKTEQNNLLNSISELQHSIEQYMREKIKENLSIDELKKYREVLLSINSELSKEKTKQKRIG